MGRADAERRVPKPKKERKEKGPKRERKPKLPKDKDPNKTDKPEVPLMNRSVHAKWGALFRKHLGVLEAHCKALDRTYQAMKSEMANLSEEEKKQWELNEDGPWRILCGLLDRARDTLTSGRKMARFVVGIKYFGMVINVHWLIDRKAPTSIDKGPERLGSCGYGICST